MMKKATELKIQSIPQLEQELLADSTTADMELPTDTPQDAARTLTTAQVRHDVSTFARALINVYSGWPFLSDIERRRVLVALKKIQDNAHDGMTSADLFNQLKPIVEQFSDNHMCLMMGKQRARTAMAKRARPNVGANIAGNDVVKLEMRGDVAVIAISSIGDYDTYFRPIENQVADMLDKSSALVVDLRGNGGGNSRATDLLARRLYGAYVPAAKRGFIRATPDSAVVHARKKKLTWVEKNDGSGTVLVFDDTKYLNAQFASEGPAYHKPIYVLTDAHTMSSAEMFCTRIRPHPHVKFVGDNTRGGEVYGDVGQVILGESTIKFIFGCIYRELVQENFELNGYAPNIRVADGADAYEAAMQDFAMRNRAKPKTLYHGSRAKIDDGFIRAKPAHINGMQTEITAAFATSDFARARLYAVMQLIGNGWSRPDGNDTIYIEKIKPHIPPKAYIYEVDSDGFSYDNNDEYYCLTDKPIKNVIEIDIIREIKNGNIKVRVLKNNKIDLHSGTDKENLELWRKTLRHRDNFALYRPNDTTPSDMHEMQKIAPGNDK